MRPSKRLVQSTIVAVILAVAGLVSQGLPGAIVLEAATSLARMFGAPSLVGHQAWCAALGISLLGPLALALILAYLGASRASTSRPIRILLTIPITLMIDLTSSFVCLSALDHFDCLASSHSEGAAPIPASSAQDAPNSTA